MPIQLPYVITIVEDMFFLFVPFVLLVDGIQRNVRFAFIQTLVSRQLDQTDMSSEVRRQDEDFGGEEIETTDSDLQQTMLGRKCPTNE